MAVAFGAPCVPPLACARARRGHRFGAGTAATAPRRALHRPAAAADDAAAAPATPAAPSGAAEPAQPASRPLGAGGSTWSDVEGWANVGEDVLYQLGKQSPSMRIDMGARSGIIDDLFVGKFMGQQADIASGALRMYERRTLAHLCGDYAIPPRFMDAVTLHLVKNFLAESGQLSHGVPLILGIWGAKGCGKSFNVELVCKKMGVQPIIMSSGELEDEYAGEPGRRIRERYRMASQTVRNSGIMSCLIINDLDAGCGRFRNTQMTVNNQIVMGTLMNLADHPTRASVGESWREDKTLRRVPIIITGNDLSTLYAPLLRDGRMTKFLWQPEREDLLEMMHTLYRDDGLSRDDVAALLDAFPQQGLDFFGALRARQHDSLIRAWAGELGEVELGNKLRAVLRRRDNADPPEPPVPGLPDFAAAGAATLSMLMAAGHDLEREQEEVNSHKLSDEYLKVMTGGASLIGFG